METLFLSLSQRRRPEDVAELTRVQLKGRLSADEAGTLERVARGALSRRLAGYTSMLQDFARPRGLVAQVARARELFATAEALSADACTDPRAVEHFIRTVGAEIRKCFGASDFLHDRLNGDMRVSEGLDISRRRYNRGFRLLRRMEVKLAGLVRELERLELTQVGKSGLATRITRADFMASESSACFVAYLVARMNLRSEFTIGGQQRPLDAVAAMLLARCVRDPATSWLAVAHVYPQREVLARLTEHDKLALFSTWFALLRQIAARLEETWDRSRFDLRTMIVRRGDDSSTWNATASAWNRARDHFIALVFALGMEDLFDAMWPGKVMRLMAADVAAWHRVAGDGLDPGTRVWADLPRPWEVLTGKVRCSRSDVAVVCLRHGVDPGKSGWTMPRPPGKVAPFRPTPELVHGVTVNSPHLAAVLRWAGWYSGKPGSVKAPTEGPATTIDA
jgi:hypothetical protein